tara:strand:- start:21 stop:422 length:402 start_codon:yes stop_codon:yes gene_type:complete
MSYRKLSFYMMMMGIGALGLFNSYKLEIRYETNSNLELLCQNGIIISSVIICFFFLSFLVEVIVMRKGSKKYRSPGKPDQSRKHVSWKNNTEETVLHTKDSESDDSSSAVTMGPLGARSGPGKLSKNTKKEEE